MRCVVDVLNIDMVVLILICVVFVCSTVGLHSPSPSGGPGSPRRDQGFAGRGLPCGSAG